MPIILFNPGTIYFHLAKAFGEVSQSRTWLPAKTTRALPISPPAGDSPAIYPDDFQVRSNSAKALKNERRRAERA